MAHVGQCDNGRTAPRTHAKTRLRGATIVFHKRLGEIMPSFLVQRVDFRPWWRKEYALVVAIDAAEILDPWLKYLVWATDAPIG